MDQFRKNKEKAEEHETPPPRGQTLAEILSDKNNSHLFGLILEKDNQHDLAGKIASGKLEQDDINALEEYRLKYAEKIAQSERIENLLTEETVIAIARQNPDFAKIVNLVGPKKAIKAIRSQLKETCISDENRFNLIAEPIEIYESYKNGAYKKINEDVEKLCKDNKIKPEEYLKALAIEDEDEKEEALKKLARGQHGGFVSAMRAVFRVNARLVGKLEGAEASMEDSMAQLDDYKNDIGNVLFSSVNGGEDMRNALARELLSENAPAPEKKTGFGDAKKDARFDEVEVDKKWKTFKEAAEYDTHPEDQEHIKDMFIDEQIKEHEGDPSKKMSFWEHVFSSLFAEKIKDKRNKLN